MLKTVVKQKQQNAPMGITNPINANEESETFKRMTVSFKEFIEHFDNKKIDTVIQAELGKDYPIFSLLVKERLFTN